MDMEVAFSFLSFLSLFTVPCDVLFASILSTVEKRSMPESILVTKTKTSVLTLAILVSAGPGQ